MASELRLTTLANNAGTESVDTTYVINGSAKAWVNYDGATNTAEDSFNVASVTDGGTGIFTVNYSSNMSNSTPAIVVTTTDTSFAGISDKSNVSSSSARFETDNSASSNRDRNYNGFVAHGDLA